MSDVVQRMPCHKAEPVFVLSNWDRAEVQDIITQPHGCHFDVLGVGSVFQAGVLLVGAG